LRRADGRANRTGLARERRDDLLDQPRRGPRFYLFDRVYAHVNAYGDHGSCSDHGGGSITCTGYNDDPNATYAFNEGHRSVSFGWGRSNENPRSFFISGAHRVTFRGHTNGNFGTFAITQVENFPGVPTAPH
jgi:hypothetical protein